MCNKKSNFHKLCIASVSMLWGMVDSNNEVFTSKYAELSSRGTSSTSTFVLHHYRQIILADDVVMMNFGKAKNIAKYGSEKPPKYPLDKVTAPVAAYGALGDALTPAKGVERLCKVLPNVVSCNIIQEKFFNHVEYAIHPRLNEILWDDIFELMGRF